MKDRGEKDIEKEAKKARTNCVRGGGLSIMILTSFIRSPKRVLGETIV